MNYTWMNVFMLKTLLITVGWFLVVPAIGIVGAFVVPEEIPEFAKFILTTSWTIVFLINGVIAGFWCAGRIEHFLRTVDRLKEGLTS